MIGLCPLTQNRTNVQKTDMRLAACFRDLEPYVGVLSDHRHMAIGLFVKSVKS